MNFDESLIDMHKLDDKAKERIQAGSCVLTWVKPNGLPDMIPKPVSTILSNHIHRLYPCDSQVKILNGSGPCNLVLTPSFFRI